MWARLRAWYHSVWTDRPLQVGQHVHGYRIDTILGVGSYGIAYLATKISSGERVVLKQVKPSRAHDAKGLPMQQYEMNVLLSLHHPRIPRVLDHFVWEDHSFMAMSYIQGQTVEDYLFEQGGTFTEVDAVRLVRKIAIIVQELHQQGIIHRDVRIPNVILQDGEPYLIDFGLARFLGDPPTYIADNLDDYPEEKQLKRQVHVESDLYALGHFLLFLLYSTYEPTGEAEKSWEEELTLTPEIRGMLHRLLQIGQAYESVGGFLQDMDAYLAVYDA
ncbi:serine/threonine protein kinase [Brevibacillus dissolubilis]|uniref:serine/threonine protein kinase n=1 Tax=Brevibacillus dissolubilis TaxID=1844116 RepID=UPI001116F84B|nr:serine/threonine-protein kinase [Brevibacillus dissolubilis]